MGAVSQTTFVHKVQVLDPIWMPVDEPGQVVLRQRYRFELSGVSRTLVRDVARYLEAEIDWAVFGGTILPFGLSLDVPGLDTAGQLLSVFIGIEGGSVVQAQTGFSLASTLVIVSAAMPVGHEASNLEPGYERQHAVDQALVGLVGVCLDFGGVR